jgi:hypothetical protein
LLLSLFALFLLAFFWWTTFLAHSRHKTHVSGIIQQRQTFSRERQNTELHEQVKEQKLQLANQHIQLCAENRSPVFRNTHVARSHRFQDTLTVTFKQRELHGSSTAFDWTSFLWPNINQQITSTLQKYIDSETIIADIEN